MAVVKEMKKNWKRLQRSAARIVLKMVHLCTQDIASDLGWDPLKTRREKHIVKLVKNCLDGQAPSYFSDYFRRRTYDIHDYDTRAPFIRPKIFGTARMKKVRVPKKMVRHG